jgi:hypothetical protein
MKFRRYGLFAAIFLLAGACATFGKEPVNAGDSEATVISKLGTPTNRYQDGNDRLLEYMKGPWGQQTYMARIGPDGNLISYQQVLTTEKFAAIKVGQTTKGDVLKTIGAPSDTSYLTLSQMEVWSYPYKESNVWNSVMHVHFDRAGVVQRMQGGPDLRFDPDSRWPGVLRRM